MEIGEFGQRHLGGILALCRAEGWPTLPQDPERALRILTAPGSSTVVAEEAGAILGFCQVLSDGEVQGCCTQLLVAPPSRRRGLGRALLLAAAVRSRASRVDLLAAEAAVPFYRTLPGRQWVGFRVYPDAAAGGR